MVFGFNLARALIWLGLLLIWCGLGLVGLLG